jgi:hypothetical protein
VWSWWGPGPLYQDVMVGRKHSYSNLPDQRELLEQLIAGPND